MFNEENGIPELARRLGATMNASPYPAWEWIEVDDGSHDNSFCEIQKHLSIAPFWQLLRLSRNFGQQAAYRAGLEAASGEAVIFMDADMQDPPELIPQMLELWAHGKRLVVGQRTTRLEKEYLEKLAARLEIMSPITFHAGFQGQEYQKALMEHSVFLLPSFREGSPGTILEAMLAGQIPVVVKASAQGEIVDSACGFPVRVGSKNQICEELAKALIRLHEIPDLRKALSDASHKKIQNEYCTSHFENKLEAAYRAALGKKPLPPCPKV
jgi:glycosyltransferase involved in cell wall biosynthesis